MRIAIIVEVDPDNVDETSPTGITADAHDRLLGIVGGPGLDSWLGDVQDVRVEPE